MSGITYWHMQIHPDDQTFSDENVCEILEHKKIIGLGEWEEEINQIPNFINEMKVNDVVAIKNGGKLIALVQVIGGVYDVTDDSNELTSWIIHRRPIRVLDWAIAPREHLPHTRGTLTRCVDKAAPTTQMIEQWHKDVIQSFKQRKIDLTV